MTTREFYDTFARYGASTTYMRYYIRLEASGGAELVAP
jgi:hypothetical protein